MTKLRVDSGGVVTPNASAAAGEVGTLLLLSIIFIGSVPLAPALPDGGKSEYDDVLPECPTTTTAMAVVADDDESSAISCSNLRTLASDVSSPLSVTPSR